MEESSNKLTRARRIKASEFKARCLSLMDEVAETGKEIVITKYGRPVSRLVPHRSRPKKVFGADREVIQVHGDLIAPIPLAWEAEAGEPVDDGR